MSLKLKCEESMTFSKLPCRTRTIFLKKGNGASTTLLNPSANRMFSKVDRITGHVFKCVILKPVDADLTYLITIIINYIHSLYSLSCAGS